GRSLEAHLMHRPLLTGITDGTRARPIYFGFGSRIPDWSYPLSRSGFTFISYERMMRTARPITVITAIGFSTHRSYSVLSPAMSRNLRRGSGTISKYLFTGSLVRFHLSHSNCRGHGVKENTLLSQPRSVWF